MHGIGKEKHKAPVPSIRQLRRTCSKELYRTIKKLRQWIPPEKVEEAEKLYFKKVVANIHYVVEHANNRKRLADLWDEQVGPEIAELWGVEVERLNRAFRDAFGG